jgi:hypothetical protein
LQAARYYLGGRGAWIALAVLAIGGGFVLNWSWLLAAGVAPLLGALLPCLAMCALPLCMNRGGGRGCKQNDTTPAAESREGAQPS